MDMGKAHCSIFAIDFVAFGNADKLLVRQVVEDLLQNAASQACVKAEAALRWRLESFFSEGGGWITMDSDGYNGLLIGFEIRDSTLVTQSDGPWKRQM